MNVLTISKCKLGHHKCSLGIAQLSYKGLNSVALAVDDKLRKYGAVCSRTSCASDPPLRSTKMRRVNDKLVRGLVKRGCRLKASNIRSMREFSHAKAADDAVETENTALDPVAWKSAWYNLVYQTH